MQLREAGLIKSSRQKIITAPREAILGLPPRKEHINLRVDADVVAWFRQTGRGYQTRMNNVLRAFVESRKRMRER